MPRFKITQERTMFVDAPDALLAQALAFQTPVQDWHVENVTVRMTGRAAVAP